MVRQMDTLRPHDTGLIDLFGFSLVLGDNVFVSGAPLHRLSNNGDLGSAYIYRKMQSGNWEEEAELNSFGMPYVSEFGEAVAMNGDVVAVKGDHIVDGQRLGFINLFRFDGQRWNPEAMLTQNDTAEAVNFGASLAVSENFVFVGAPPSQTNASVSLVYIFFFDGTSWLLDSQLLAGDGTPNDAFGVSIVIHNNTLVVGAPGHDAAGPNSGIVYVFQRQGRKWVQVAQLLPSDNTSVVSFGRRVSIHDDTIAISAINEANAGQRMGEVFLFKRRSTVPSIWEQEARLMPNVFSPFISFGESLGVTDRFVTVGSPNDNDAEITAGAVYLYQRFPNGWQLVSKIHDNHAALGDLFGLSVSISPDTLIAGLPGRGISNWDIGGVSVFSLPLDLDGDGLVDDCPQVVTALDIYPGACRNPLNLRNRGVIPIAIVGMEGFDVSQIDVDSITLFLSDQSDQRYVLMLSDRRITTVINDVTSPSAANCGCAEPNQNRRRGVTDGIDDLVLHISSVDLITMLAIDAVHHPREITLTVNGKLQDGAFFKATDCITLVGRPEGNELRKSGG